MPDGEAISSGISSGEATSSQSRALPTPFRLSSSSDPILSSLGRAAEIVESIIIRQIRDDTGQRSPSKVGVLPGRPFTTSSAVIEATPLPTPTDEDIQLAMDDPIVNNIEDLIEGFKAGTSVDAIKEEVRKLVVAQEERTELVHSLIVMHDLDRLPAYLRTRKIIEQYLLRIAQRQDLSPAEGLALLKVAKDEIDKITSHLRSRASSVKDVDNLINKADFAQHLSDSELAKKFAQTSTLGREIIRKVSFRILRAAQDHAAG